MSKSETVNNSIETAEEVARKIWLAGLGAYGKGFEEIQSQYEKLNNDTSHLFEELVSKGQKLEADTKKKLKANGSVGKHIEDVRKTLGLDTSDIDAKIDKLSKKVDALTVAVSKIS